MSKKKPPDYNVPFSQFGLHDYPDWQSCHRDDYDPQTFSYRVHIDYRTEVPEVPAFEFSATLHYTSYSRGRSSATFWFKSVEGEHIGKFFPVQMANMSVLIPKLEHGALTGRFLTRKQGQNFGIELVQ